MIIIGAKGHAKEIYDVLDELNLADDLCFFDNVSTDLEEKLFHKLILNNFQSVNDILKTNPNFVLGLGGVKHRFNLYNQFIKLNGKPNSVIASNAFISKSSQLGEGLNIMPFTSINAETFIGTGSLINSHASIHHNSIIDEFVEVSPGARILGNCKIGKFTTIGTNATILPKIKVGKNVIVAACAVVTQDIPDNCMVAGIPATIKKELPYF